LFLFFAEDKYGDEVRKNIWKERGTGDIRILKHKESKQERVVMRQEKTFKLILNHIINPMTVLVTFLVWSESVERKCWK
jgi:singapore isolate B (sub-type 7) whole genome shotgun sequence assembly, scaffold_17